MINIHRIKESFVEKNIAPPITIDANGHIIDGYHRWRVIQLIEGTLDTPTYLNELWNFEKGEEYEENYGS